MKLRNKKTGEIVNFETDIYADTEDRTYEFKSIAELNKEWEDYEEPKKWWFIDCTGFIKHGEGLFTEKSYIKDIQQIGNYFETKEEAEKAVRKLKAWKRLKDKGFRFTLTPGVGSLDITPGKFQIEINAEMPEKWFCCDAVQNDLEVCFGGEE